MSRPAPAEGRPAVALRGLTGLLAGGLVVLVVALVTMGVVAGREHAPGPGAVTIGWHVLAAVVAVGLQWFADRTRGVRGVAACGVVVVITVAVLATWIA